jgi:hypothetical protein
MKLQEVQDFFTSQKLSIKWLIDGATPMKLKPDSGTLEFKDDVAVVIPDVHLGTGPGDVFQEQSPERIARLENLLDVLASLRDKVSSAKFQVVQLGDFYDLWRKSPSADYFETCASIESQYSGIIARGRALPILHCIGNHDAAFYRMRPPTSQIDAAVWRTIGDKILCFHGHDTISLRDLQVDPGAAPLLLSLTNSISGIPLLGPLDLKLQKYFDNSFFEDSIFSKPSLTSLPWPHSEPGADGWSALWVDRAGRGDIANMLFDAEGLAQIRIDVAFLGHSHRPGISWCRIEQNRRIPLVDVGSWTYGRSEFAIVCSDGIGLACIV